MLFKNARLTHAFTRVNQTRDLHMPFKCKLNILF